MHLIQGTHKAPKLAREDLISNMPDDVLTNILDRLPIQDAVRTSILARNWRFNWTLLSQLVFDENFYYYLTRTNDESKLGRIINRLLLHVKGAIIKFSLCMLDELDDADIANWILLLSKKGVKDLAIWKMGIRDQLKLPTHLFSCLELKRLKLTNCCLSPPSTFRGFPNLLSLELHLIRFETRDLRGFLTCCPSLEILISTCTLKAVWIAKLENIKILSMYLSMLDRDIMMRFLDSLPKLQELELNFRTCKLTEGGANKRCPTFFLSLKFLTLTRISLHNGVMLSCSFELITSCPNLLFLEITTENWDADSPPQVDYDILWPLWLRGVASM
ncbi:F-box/FBD/LRR-repeat protein At1g13570-like [Bidens hawaiensis]|uniref:F-box/FBD/LRR-repeat protein At1g13570-like n=1 Tax=Bidens hawaiensis TaxID=980011 RepID=UPI00404A3EFD